MVTDLDILVSLGYSKELSRKALAETKGDRSAALEFIRTSGQKSNNDWKSYKSESDWKNNITISNLPKDSTMRALWKSPVTVHVNSSFRAQNGSFLYRCKIITLTKGWVCNKSYEDFVSFKASLPFGTTLWFKNIFPSPWVKSVSSILSFIVRNDKEESAEADKRRELLDEWIRFVTCTHSPLDFGRVLAKLFISIKMLHTVNVLKVDEIMMLTTKTALRLKETMSIMIEISIMNYYNDIDYQDKTYEIIHGQNNK